MDVVFQQSANNEAASWMRGAASSGNLNQCSGLLLHGSLKPTSVTLMNGWTV